MEVLDRLDAERVRTALDRGELLWVDLFDPDEATIARAGELLSLHPLAIEDTNHFGQRPKLDDYAGAVLLVFYGARSGRSPAGDFPGLPELVEVHLHITATAILSIRRIDIPELAEASRVLRRREVATSEEALYRVLDALTMSFVEPLRQIEDEVDALEDMALDDPAPPLRRRLLSIKHALLVLRQFVEPQRDLMASRREVIERLPGFTEDAAHDYLRDVHDHLARTSRQIESVRELVTNALDLYLSTVSNRLNEVMKVLTIIATIFLPLTFITGFFGQNFGWMVRNVASLWAFLVLGVGLALVVAAVLWLAFVRAGYVGRTRPRRRLPAAQPPPAPGP